MKQFQPVQQSRPQGTGGKTLHKYCTNIYISDRPNVRFGRTSTVRFGPNDRTFFCRTQNFFSLLYIAFFKMAALDLLSLTER